MHISQMIGVPHLRSGLQWLLYEWKCFVKFGLNLILAMLLVCITPVT